MEKERIRLLNVDDQDVPRYVKTRDLQAAGFDVVEARNGAEALRLVDSERPPAVLLDVQLPDIDGFDVAQRITGHPDSPAVILVSSRDSSDFGPLVSRSGARGFVPKAELSGERVQELLV